MNNTLLAAISGDDLVKAVIWIVVVGVIFGLLWWLIDYAGLPTPFAKVAKVLVAVVAVILVIRFLLKLTGVSL